MNYRIVTENTPSDLSDRVNDLIGKGWKPHGSPFTSSYACGQGHVSHVSQVDHTIFLSFHQAMTKD